MTYYYVFENNEITPIYSVDCSIDRVRMIIYDTLMGRSKYTDQYSIYRSKKRLSKYYIGKAGRDSSKVKVKRVVWQSKKSPYWYAYIHHDGKLYNE